jgi:hypothetical protein
MISYKRRKFRLIKENPKTSKKKKKKNPEQSYKKSKNLAYKQKKIKCKIKTISLKKPKKELKNNTF